jgi:hypothetical protein
LLRCGPGEGRFAHAAGARNGDEAVRAQQFGYARQLGLATNHGLIMPKDLTAHPSVSRRPLLVRQPDFVILGVST